MTDHRFYLSTAMIRALLAGTKTQARVILKPALNGFENNLRLPDGANAGEVRLVHTPGDRLWVPETHALVPPTAYRMSEGVQQTVCPDAGSHTAAIYREGWDRSTGGLKWRGPASMPRWASRLTLTVTEVRVDRVRDISREDAIAEGLVKVAHAPPMALEMGCYWGFSGDSRYGSPVSAFACLWNSQHGEGAWDANPWVAALTFTVARGNIDKEPT